MVLCRTMLFPFFLILLLLIQLQIFAKEPEKIKKVVVTSMVVDADKARQNAIRSAGNPALFVTDGQYTVDAELKMDVNVWKYFSKVDVSMSTLE